MLWADCSRASTETERIKSRPKPSSPSDTRRMQIRVEVKTESRLFPIDSIQGVGFRFSEPKEKCYLIIY